MIEWHIQVIPIKSLKNNPKNPRRISKEQMAHLEGLVQTYGLIDKPIINKDFTIIGGHQRIRVLKKMKAKTVECWMPDRLLEPSEIDHLCIGLNLNQGEFDYDILANQWDPIDLIKWGFTEKQLIGSCQEAEEIEGVIQKQPTESKTTCPRCGHEF